MNDTIAKIISSNVKEGISKTGKPWQLMSILTESGKEATIFAPAAEGDSIILEYNPKYKNYSAKRATETTVKRMEADNKLDEINEKLDTIINLLTEKEIEPEIGGEESSLPF